MTSFDLSRPESGNVIDLILDDHRRFEDLLRAMRDVPGDRRAALDAFATLHVAHARAEESEVYPVVKTKDGVDADEAEHGEEEHAEGNEALLAVLEVDDLEGEDFADRLEDLGEMVNHHLGEEELNILTPAREAMQESVLNDLGAAFCARRNEQIDAGCGDVSTVRDIVEKARRSGLLDD